jgi:hypothetical protein
MNALLLPAPGRVVNVICTDPGNDTAELRMCVDIFARAMQIAGLWDERQRVSAPATEIDKL